MVAFILNRLPLSINLISMCLARLRLSCRLNALSRTVPSFQGRESVTIIYAQMDNRLPWNVFFYISVLCAYSMPFQLEGLNAFVEPETLDDTNQYYCEKCDKKCDAKKGLKFTK